jgi:4-amino-4-deoxy-L-arabinose transferase-like glycosyltransferase
MSDVLARPVATPAILAVPREAYAAISLLLLQAGTWVGLAVWFQGSIDNDVAEGVVDGPAWQLSYLRHPPLSSWLSGLASMTGPARYLVLYTIALGFACGAFAIVASFIARLEGRAAGLVVLMAGFASPYASYWPIKFNHNIGVMPFWAMTIWAAWYAFESGALGAWALLGIIVGLGLWAKYAILQLVIPLGLLFFAVPEWRRKAATPGPWIAGATCLGIVAPQLIDVLRKGATTFQWAVHATDSSALERARWMGEFVLGCLLANAPLALIAWAACGRARLLAAIRSMFAFKTRSRLDLFLHSAAFGPILVIVLAAPFGVHLFYHWATALSVSFAAWWGRAAGRAGLRNLSRRAWILYGAWAALSALGYVGLREIAPLQSPLGTSAYAEMDGPALAELAKDYWLEHENGPIPYIVSYGGKIGFQAAGSIVFDLPYRVHALKDGLSMNAPWIDIADLRRRGALVVLGNEPATNKSLDGVNVEVSAITAFPRPTMRGAKAPPIIYFGVIAPGS